MIRTEGLVCESCKSRRFVSSGKSTIICQVCGIEKYILDTCNFQNCGFSMSHAPFLSGYSRTKRFRQMVEALFYPTPSNPDTKMLKVLYKNMEKINSQHDLVTLITESGLKDKRFVSLHMFCRLFNPQYKKPTHDCLFRMMDRMIHNFKEIELNFKWTFPGKPFINYTYLVRHLLLKLGYTSYLPFVKNLKCEKRKTHYNQMLAILSGGEN